MTHEELEIVENYASEVEASIAHSKLEAYGLHARVLSSRKVGRHGAELPSRTIVAVRAEDLTVAREILADHSAALAETPEGRLPPSADELCRFCGAEELERVRDGATLQALRWMFRFRRHYRCRRCGRDQ